MDLDRIQESLRRQNLDAWLFFDHHGRDPLAYKVLGLTQPSHVTRRWYYVIPAHGEPAGLVHRIEPGVIAALPGEQIKYSTWQEQHAGIAVLLGTAKRIAMQYSPLCAVPYVAMVDAGTVELVRSLGVDVRSSAELIQEFEACLTDLQFESHIEAGQIMDTIRAGAFRLIGQKLGKIDELTVRDWIRDQFHQNGLATDAGPIVGVNAHAGNPHYDPTPETNQPINHGDLVLIDMWARFDRPNAVFYDITWTGMSGEPSSRVREVFETVRDARDKAVETVKAAVHSGSEIRGFEVDDAARGHIVSKGFGKEFVHRTGHSIGTEVHGAGANMDNLETHDERRLLPGSLFSIEPGIYLEDFGVRAELNMYVTRDSAVTTGEVQHDLVIFG